MKILVRCSDKCHCQGFAIRLNAFLRCFLDPCAFSWKHQRCVRRTVPLFGSTVVVQFHSHRWQGCSRHLLQEHHEVRHWPLQVVRLRRAPLTGDTPYNAVLCAHSSLEHADFAVILDDEALYSMCRRNLDIELYRLLAWVILWCIAPGHHTIGNSMADFVRGQLLSPSKILGGGSGSSLGYLLRVRSLNRAIQSCACTPRLST